MDEHISEKDRLSFHDEILERIDGIASLKPLKHLLLPSEGVLRAQRSIEQGTRYDPEHLPEGIRKKIYFRYLDRGKSLPDSVSGKVIFNAIMVSIDSHLFGKGPMARGVLEHLIPSIRPGAKMNHTDNFLSDAIVLYDIQLLAILRSGFTEEDRQILWDKLVDEYRRCQDLQRLDYLKINTALIWAYGLAPQSNQHLDYFSVGDTRFSYLEVLTLMGTRYKAELESPGGPTVSLFLMAAPSFDTLFPH